LKRRFPQIVALAKKKGAAILFVDEAGVRPDQNRGTTWGKVGETPVVKANGSRFSLGLISAVGSRGELYFEVFEGRMNGARFVEFLQRLHRDIGRPIIVILDNVSYHRSRPVKKFIRSQKGGIIAHYLPEYSPELNPDEQVWNSLKARLSRLFIATKAQLRAEVERVLSEIRSDRKLVTSFFRLATTKYAAVP
jgi:transposase